jgi:hypothetical protein
MVDIMPKRNKSATSVLQNYLNGGQSRNNGANAPQFGQWLGCVALDL